MNYFDSDLKAEALKLRCYVPPTFLDDETIPSPIFYTFYAFWMATDYGKLENGLKNTNTEAATRGVL